jgi:site-specific DNA-methyltransferase (adenine-specific)
MSAARNTILTGEALAQLRTLPKNSIDTVVTSPPYFLLRRYDAGDGEIGIEETVTDYVRRLVAVLDELARVLKPGGSVWLNLSDGYSRHERYGAPPKSLLLAPERVLTALSNSGWIVRNKVVWAKPNPMPASVRDRLTCSWEALFLLVRSPLYFFDLDAIRIPHRSQRSASSPSGDSLKYNGGKRPEWAGPLAGSNDGLLKARAEGRSGHLLGKNPGDVWTVATAGYRGAHFATFPETLIRRPILATCPERVCSSCGKPWKQASRSSVVGSRVPTPRDDYVMRHASGWLTLHERGELEPGCGCQVGFRPGLVLDPFMGSGTTALVAESLGREWLGIELKPDYVELATERIATARTQRKEVMNKKERRQAA